MVHSSYEMRFNPLIVSRRYNKDMDTIQVAKAKAFADMHTSHNILVLPNAWDAASARVFGTAGFSAIGTTSAGIAFSHGYADGEKLPKAKMLEALREIVEVTTLPVTADIESGYADSAEAQYDFIKEVIATGVVGVNIEDALQEHDSTLIGIKEQVAKITAARQAARDIGIPLVINARTDTYWRRIGSDAERLSETVRRLKAYKLAGADSVFVPGVNDVALITALLERVDCPLNILGGPDAPSISTLEKLGVARVSVGSGPVRAVLALAMHIARELHNGTYFAGDAVSYQDANKLFNR